MALIDEGNVFFVASINIKCKFFIFYLSEIPPFCLLADFSFFAFAIGCGLISLFLSEICSFLPAADQCSNIASKCSNIQSFSFHNVNISIHLILFYSSIYKELKIAFIFDKCVRKFLYLIEFFLLCSMKAHSVEFIK